VDAGKSNAYSQVGSFANMKLYFIGFANQTRPKKLVTLTQTFVFATQTFALFSENLFGIEFRKPGKSLNAIPGLFIFFE
jgi:hypothetical protein